MGARVPIEIDTLIESLEKGLPETRDMLLEVGKQLHNILRTQIPVRRLVGFSSIPRTRLADEPPDLPKPTLWRRVTRWSFDVLMKRRRLRAPPKAPQAGATDPTPPAIKRYPPRSWDSRGAKLFEDSGFLAGEAPWIAQVRLQHRAWFELISKLNREELFVAALYARTVETFQGAALLAGVPRIPAVDENKVLDLRRQLRREVNALRSLLDPLPATMRRAHIHVLAAVGLGRSGHQQGFEQALEVDKAV